jgi:HEAT repeat protein
LLEGLEDEDAGVRAAAAWACAAPEAAGAFAASVARLLGDSDSHVREEADAAVREMGAEGTLIAVSELESGRPERRCAALWAIGIRGTAGAKYAFSVKERLADADFSVRRAAV